MLSDPSISLPALRQLLAQRFPTAPRTSESALPTGIPAVDDAAGGLPKAGLTELVCSAPSCGSQLFLGQLLHVTRTAGLRVALVDRDDAFDPGSWPPPVLEHLVWVRARSTPEAIQATDLLARDANLGLIVLDLRHAAPAELRRVISPTWYRLQRAVEPSQLAGLILTPFPLVPSAHLRLELGGSHAFPVQGRVRPELIAGLAPEFLRQRSSANATA